MRGKFKDITGMRFGKLVVKERSKNSRTGFARWVCKCDCGAVKTVFRNSLAQGKTVSCGCSKPSFRKGTVPVNKKNLIGMRFGSLVVTGESKSRRLGCVMWECKCDCGVIINTFTSNLTSYGANSCGCKHLSRWSGHAKEGAEKLAKRYREDLAIPYVARLLRVGMKLKNEDIPLELIEVKRMQIKIQREIKRCAA